MPRTITAAVTHEAGAPFALEPVELADPGPGEVLVEIRAIGICHTDIAARDGIFGLPYPMVLGHEGSGVIAQVGADVSSVAVGDHVALSFDSCGHCGPCEKDHPAYCGQFPARNYGGRRPDGSTTTTQDGRDVTASFFGQSSFATHAIATERNVVKVDRDLPLELLGPLGCGIQTGAGAVFNSLDCPTGSSLLVVGAGPVGLAAVMAAKVRGCAAIIVSEPSADRRALALKLGATDVLDPRDGDLADQVRTHLSDGVDYAFDTSGSVPVIESIIGTLAAGGTLGLVGVPGDFSASMALPLIPAMAGGLTVKGITEGDSDPQTFIPELLKLYRDGRFPFADLITTFPFSAINEAVEAQHRGEATKVVLVHD
ncbi:NAD(P)-dependent alcohol dehydrogenase [Patulibacter minatonensis]|uniref:NAD(P)-dependent alcohol dehydrogenase n=1 Tax=Patulibacter minatonensis TaxID=298163 RepID=UPI00047A6BEE|nr:NAD(P)-dependent alcohol dehydrogenase [Patulibacter minatonensis]